MSNLKSNDRGPLSSLEPYEKQVKDLLEKAIKVSQMSDAKSYTKYVLNALQYLLNALYGTQDTKSTKICLNFLQQRTDPKDTTQNFDNGNECKKNTLRN